MAIRTAPPASLSSFDVSIASSVKDRLKLRDVQFAATEGRVMAAPDDGATLELDLPRVEVRWFRAGDELRVVVPYNLNIAARKDSVAAPGIVAEIRVVLRIDYVATGNDLTDEMIDHFVGISTFLHSWPYFRAEVAELTTKLRFPPLTLPVALSGNAEQCFVVSKLRPEEAGMPTDADADVTTGTPDPGAG